MSKYVNRIPLPDLVSMVADARNVGSLLRYVATAKMIKACDGQVMSDVEFTIDAVRPQAYDRIHSWIAKSRGEVLWRDSTRALVVLRSGVLTLHRSRRSLGRVARYGHGRKSKVPANPPNSVDITIDLAGLETWVKSTSMKLQELCAEFKVERPTRKVEKKLHVLNFTRKGIGVKAIAQFDDELERENYTERVLGQFDTAVRELSSESPSGRLLIIHGPPGTGKTYMVRSMINAIKRTQCLLVPSQYVPEFTKPQLGNFLIKRRKPTCLILEDADELLITRGADNMTAINSMLNLSDGMFGMVSDVRLVCTTNARKLEIEPALLRDGRLLDQIHVEQLDPEHASRVLARLTGKPAALTKKATLAELYKLARGEEGKG